MQSFQVESYQDAKTINYLSKIYSSIRIYLQSDVKDENVFKALRDISELHLAIRCPVLEEEKGSVTQCLLNLYKHQVHPSRLMISTNSQDAVDQIAKFPSITLIVISNTGTKNINLSKLFLLCNLVEIELDGNFHYPDAGNQILIKCKISRGRWPDLLWVRLFKNVSALNFDPAPSFLTSLNGIEDSAIEDFRLTRAVHLTDLTLIESAIELKYLKLGRLSKVSFLPDFSNLNKLKMLELNDMNMLKDISSITNAKYLEGLVIENGKNLSLESILSLKLHPSLQKIRIGLNSFKKNSLITTSLPFETDYGLGLPPWGGFHSDTEPTEKKVNP